LLIHLSDHKYTPKQQYVTAKEERIVNLEKELLDLISSLKMRKGSSQTQVGSVAEFNDLKTELIDTKQELWRERTAAEAVRNAHVKADEVLAGALAAERDRGERWERECAEMKKKIRRLEDQMR
jgi:hypothetical protein